jgi:signal transduction histidine kinase
MARKAPNHGSRARGDSRRGPLYVAGATAAAVLCAVAVAFVAASSDADDRFMRAVLEALIIGLPIGAGLYATRSARTRRFGAMLVAAGVVWSLTALGESSNSLLYSTGRVTAWLIFPILAYLVLAYPDGRIAPGVDRWLLGSVAAVIAVLYVGSSLVVEAYPLQTPWATCRASCPANAFFVLDAEPAVVADVLAPLREALGVLLFCGLTASVLARWRAAPLLRRRAVGPVLVMTVTSTVCLGAFLIVRRAAPGRDAVEVLGTLWSLTVPGVAAAFLVGLLRRRMMVAEVLMRLTTALKVLEPSSVRDTLALALDDAGIEVRMPDADGRVRPEAGNQHILTPLVGLPGAPAVLVHDPSLLDDDELLPAVRALVLATLQHARLTGELDDSRKRIARAADVERSRIERDLHDGAQQRLIGLRIKLSLAEELAQADPVAGAAAMHDLGGDMELTLEELRSLAHGVYPSLLSDRGLVDALRSAVAESPLPAHVLTHHLQRQSPEIETAVYFACSEAVQNAIKHARGATGLWVSVWQNTVLGFEVRDDGVGFEPPSGAFNGGLRNMHDRVEAIGGELRIVSAPGHGTCVRGSVPLQ